MGFIHTGCQKQWEKTGQPYCGLCGSAKGVILNPKVNLPTPKLLGPTSAVAPSTAVPKLVVNTEVKLSWTAVQGADIRLCPCCSVLHWRNGGCDVMVSLLHFFYIFMFSKRFLCIGVPTTRKKNNMVELE